MFELVSENTWTIVWASLIFIFVMLLIRLWILWGQRMDSVIEKLVDENKLSAVEEREVAMKLVKKELIRKGENIFCVDCTHHDLDADNPYSHRCNEPRAPKHLVKGDCSEAFCTTLRSEGRTKIVFGEDDQPKEMYEDREICGAGGSWFMAKKDSE